MSVQPPAQRASHRARAARFSRRPPSFVVTLVALAIVFALAWMFFVRAGEPAPAPVVRGVQGAYTWEAVVPGASGVPRETGSFGAVAAGDAGGRTTWENTAPRAGTSGSADSAYDAAGRTTTTDAARTSPLGEQTGQTVVVGAWPPAWRLDTRSPLDYQGLAAVVRTAVEDGDDAVGIKPVKDGDRPAWRAAMTLGGRQIDLVVDQQTGIVTWYSDGESAFTAKVDWAAPPPAGTTYTVDLRAGTPTKTVTKDAYVYAASPAAAEEAAGYAPLVSGLAPDGFKLRAVATVDDQARPFGWLTTETVNVRHPAGVRWPVVTQLFTRGLSWFTMEQADPGWVGSWGPRMHELAAAAREKLSYQETTLQYGAFKGETALTWYQESGPSLFVLAKRRAVFVTGALTRQELLAFAGGLRPVSRSE